MRQQQWHHRKEQKIREQQTETHIQQVLECSFQPNLSKGGMFTGVKSRYMTEGTDKKTRSISRQKSQPSNVNITTIRKSSRILPTRFSESPLLKSPLNREEIDDIFKCMEVK